MLTAPGERAGGRPGVRLAPECRAGQKQDVTFASSVGACAHPPGRSHPATRPREPGQSGWGGCAGARRSCHSCPCAFRGPDLSRRKNPRGRLTAKKMPPAASAAIPGGEGGQGSCGRRPPSRRETSVSSDREPGASGVTEREEAPGSHFLCVLRPGGCLPGPPGCV